MGIKKAKATSKQAAGKTQKPTAKTRLRKSTKPVDLVEVLKKIAEVVGPEAPDIIQAIVNEAKKGQLAHAKYALESSGVYPVSDEDSTKPEEDSLAQRLMTRLGLSEQPFSGEDDAEPDGPAENRAQTNLRGVPEPSAGKEKRTLAAAVGIVQNDTVIRTMP